MAEASKLELLLLAKDKMSPAIQRLLKLLKSVEKDGKSSGNAVDKLTKKLERAPKTDGIKKASAEIKKTATAAGEAAKAEEKLNNARKRSSSGDAKTKQETADKTKLAGATEKAAAAEEKLNNARKRGVRGSSSNRRPSSLPPSPARPSGGRGNLVDDTALAGAGIAGLSLSKKGMGAAMSQQEAFTDIYNSFYRSSLSAAEMNGQMEKSEEISIRLGNKLKGNTADFANMLSVMKQSGMEATTILDGAGEAAAYLAVANREDYSDVGKNYAKFGQLFGVKGKEDNLKIADLISRAKGKGISSEDLITSSKYFGGRTAKTMGLTGAKGAEDVLRFMTFIQQNTALDPSAVGTGSSAFFRAFTKDEQKKHPVIPEMEKKTGVKLDLFDEKGQFKGLENAVAKFAQLKGKLSDKEGLQFGQELAGDEGAAVLGAMIDAGTGYKEANQDLDEMASMMTKAAKESGNLSNKLEALTGSVENLGAESFKPMLAPLGAAADKTNDFVGYLTGFAKAQPVFSATTAGVLSITAALLTLKGGSGVLSSLASRFGGVTEAAAGSTSKIGGMAKSLTSLPTIVKIGLTVAIAAEAWEQIQKMRKTIDDWKSMNSGLDQTGASGYKAQQQEDETYKERNKGAANKIWARDGIAAAGNQAPDYKSRAKGAFDLLEQGNQEFAKALDPRKMGWYEWYSRGIGSLVGKDTNAAIFQGKPTTSDILNNPQSYARVRQVEKMPFSKQTVDGAFKDAFDRVAAEIASVKNLQSRAPMLKDPNTMTAFRRDTLPSMGLSDIKKQFVEQMLSAAFPASFAQSSQQLVQQSGILNQSFLNLVQPVNSLIDPLAGLNTNSTSATTAVGNLANATNSAANRINSIQITPPIFAPIRVPVFGQPAAPSLFGGNVLGRAKGGSMTKGHEYRINEIGQEFLTPAASGSMVSNDILRRNAAGNANSQNVSLNVHINIDGSSGDAQKLAEEIRREFTLAVSEIKAELAPDNLAKRVASSAERHAERT